MKDSSYGFMMKVALLSASLVTLSPAAIAGVIPALKEAFPTVSETHVELLATLPQFSMIIFIVLSGFFARKIGNKKTVLIGLFLTAFFGAIPYFFAESFTFIFLSRIGLGIGIGLINSLAVSMIGDFFSGQTKATLMGLRSSFEGLGQAVTTLIAGLFLLISWNTSFLAYLLALPVLVLFAIFIPQTPPTYRSLKAANPRQIHSGSSTNFGQNDTKNQQLMHTKERINVRILYLAVFLLCVDTLYFGIVVRLSTVVTDQGLGTMTEASTLLSAMTFGGVFTGAIFGQITKVLGRYTLALALMMLAVGSALLFFASSFVVIVVGAMVLGQGFPIVISYCFNLISELCEPNSATLSTSVVLVGCNVGVFGAPLTLNVVSKIFNTTSPSFPFLPYAFILASVAVIYTLLLFKRPANCHADK